MTTKSEIGLRPIKNDSVNRDEVGMFTDDVLQLDDEQLRRSHVGPGAFLFECLVDVFEC